MSGWKKPNGGSYTPPANQSVLDKFGESNGLPTYDGEDIGSSGGTTTDSSGFFYQRENLHDMDAEVAGSINTSTGALAASGTFFATEFIPVEPNTTFISNYAKIIALYDGNKTYISALATTASNTTDFVYPRPFVMPDNAEFVRYTRGTNIPQPMFVRGSILPLEYLDPGVKQLWIPSDDYVNSLRLQLDPLYGLKWNALGDSVTNGGYPDPVTGAVISYHQALASKYGITVRNYGIGGTRITATTDSQGFCQRYTAMSDDADIITVFGGINDYANAAVTPIGTLGSSDTSTIYGAMKVLCEGLLQKYPTQKLGFIIPYPFNEYRGAGTWKPYYDALVDVLNYYSIPFLDLYKNSRLNANIDFINTAYFKDGDKTHPNTKGHAIIASKVYAFLLSL